MGKALPSIKTRLMALSLITDVSRSAAGAGALVIRGLTAGAGLYIGGAVAGGVGGGIGAFLGATGPDALMKILMNPRGAKMLERAVKMGHGEVDAKTVAMISQMIAQSVARADTIEGPVMPPPAPRLPFDAEVPMSQ